MEGPSEISMEKLGEGSQKHTDRQKLILPVTSGHNQTKVDTIAQQRTQLAKSGHNQAKMDTIAKLGQMSAF